MTKDVLISIKGTQGIDDNTDTIELTTIGRFGKRDQSFFMSYDESEISGLGNVKTVLHVRNDGSVVLQRSGEYESRLTIQSGVRNTCFYNTPYGDMVIGIFGESVQNSLNTDGGELSFSYTIDSNLQLISHNVIEISVKGVKNNHVDSCL